MQGAGIPGPLGPLAVESFQMHLEVKDQLQSESSVDFYPKVISMVRVAFDESDLGEFGETLEIFEAADGFSAHWLDSSELRDLEPRISTDAIRGLYTYGNASLDSHLYTVALSKAAENLGAIIRPGAATGLGKSGERVTGVLLEDGEIECAGVVLATGPWSKDVEDWLGVPVPIEPLKGEILRMEPLEKNGPAYDFSGAGVSLYQRADGLTWVALPRKAGVLTESRASPRGRRFSKGPLG